MVGPSVLDGLAVVVGAGVVVSAMLLVLWAALVERDGVVPWLLTAVLCSFVA